MSKPNIAVINALFDFYLGYRNTEWKIYDSNSDSLKKPANSTIAAKFEACTTLFSSMQSAESLEDWINAVYNLYYQERLDWTHQQNRLLITRLIVGFFSEASEVSLLYMTLRAIRSYVISQIKEEPAFAQAKALLTDNIVGAEKNILYSQEHPDSDIGKDIDTYKVNFQRDTHKLQGLSDDSDYHHPYFLDIVKAYDPYVRTLYETSFEDFAANAVNKKRSLTVCKKLDMTSSSLAATAAASSSAAPVNDVEPVITSGVAVSCAASTQEIVRSLSDDDIAVKAVKEERARKEFAIARDLGEDTPLPLPARSAAVPAPAPRRIREVSSRDKVAGEPATLFSASRPKSRHHRSKAIEPDVAPYHRSRTTEPEAASSSRRNPEPVAPSSRRVSFKNG